MEKLICTPENAEKFKDWLVNRGGLAVWNSINFSNLGVTWTTPAHTEDGNTFPRPSWQADSKPDHIVTKVEDVIVSVDREVKRFHVAVRRGSSNPTTLKVTDGGSRRIRAAVAKAGKGAYHVFDFMTQEAVIMAPVDQVPLNEWGQPGKGK